MSEPKSDAEIYQLFEDLHADTITLQGCVQLREWVHEVYLGHVVAGPPIQKIAALLMEIALDARIVSMQTKPQEPGRGTPQ